MSDFVDDEAILNFVEVTGADPDVAKSYLTVAEGRVEQAISLFMENGGAPLTSEIPERPQTSSSAASSTSSLPREPEEVRAPIAPKREALFSNDGPSFHRGGGRRAQPVSTIPGLPPSPFMQEPLGPIIPSIANDRNSRLAELFRPPTDIIHDANTLEHAREYAKHHNKWVIVTLNDPSEFGCQVMNRDLWKDSAVQDLIKENFIFIYWGADSPPGRNHRALYPVDSYPYVAIIDPITGERMKTWSTTMTPAEFMQDASEFLARHSLHLPAPARKKKKTVTPAGQRPVTELSEEEQLELALAASMGQTKVAPAADQDETADEVEAMEDVVPSTNVFDTIEPILNEEPTGSDAVRIQFRLPDGTRKVRRFRKTDPVRTLFQYVRADVPEARAKPFELMNFRDPLLPRINDSVEDAKLAGASITVDFQ
ncbi:uncharacterized protein SPPG_00139 [Spizellomyces punctatus DAOM BR117]|uniref:UBX domain-containing protein n=1 Tax=Spizellomyces punctatus (strain DAOM BR117) TaxID=645134 RepID=A0A0L0HU55_SPIPD|nr:uncharacterized protein SPPG_00139 [Spizellomyces punctatus DAOM BR117]KND04409.1 hypothetical protein SPPG_00139 [Spizellomyces punctatus DAOM BR117]|eukprot:XP_016612448.1 hypothetical protein SPPG_00139 [Spizellomyces punctatus DAOM BR117]